MTKTQVAICLEFDQLKLLVEIRNQYKLKNFSETIELVINQWKRFLQEKIEQRAQESKKKPVNPMVNP